MVLALTVQPVLSQDWQLYENRRFKFSVEVPVQGWEDKSRPNSNGIALFPLEGCCAILVYGRILKEEFAKVQAAQVEKYRNEGRIIHDEAGWNMDLKAGPLGSHSYSSTYRGRTVELKGVVTCGGKLAIYVHIEYHMKAEDRVSAIRQRLIGSLKPPRGAACYEATKPGTRTKAKPA